jgi:quinol monooxygenase YgiN
MSDLVRVVVNIVARADAVEEVRSLVLTLARESRKEPGCISYDALQDRTQPERFALIEEWASASALDAHNKTAHFHEAVRRAGPLLAKPLDVGRFRTLG